MASSGRPINRTDRMAISLARGARRPSSPADLRRDRLIKEAQKEPAVQEALDLFDGRLVDVREAKTGQ